MKHPFHVIVKPVGDVCNLNCTYCFYKEKSDEGSRMSDETLDNLTRKYIEEQPKGCKEVQFVWQGGEPMLAGLAFYQKALQLQEKYRRPDMTITNAIQTNGTLVTNQWADFLRQHQFLVGLSVDGTKALHDNERLYCSGKGSFVKVQQGYIKLQERGVQTNILCVVHPNNVAYSTEIYQFLTQKMRATKLQFLPVVGDETIDPTAWGTFLSNVFDLWLKKGLGQVSVQLFDTAYARIASGVETFCVHAHECGNQLVVERNGSVYSCDHYVEPSHYLGCVDQHSFTEMLNSPLQIDFKRMSAMHDDVCNGCEIKGLCQSGCPKHRDSDHKNKLCSGYYAFYKHSIPYFYALAECQRRGIALMHYDKFIAQIKTSITQQVG